MDLFGFRAYTPNEIVKPHATQHYQKIVYRDDDGKIAVNVYEYDGYIFEVDIQIPEQFSIIGRTINVTVFTYSELDLPKMEQDGIVLILCNSTLSSEVFNG